MVSLVRSRAGPEIELSAQLDDFDLILCADVDFQGPILSVAWRTKLADTVCCGYLRERFASVRVRAQIRRTVAILQVRTSPSRIV